MQLSLRGGVEMSNQDPKFLQPGDGMNFNSMAGSLTYKATVEDTEGAFSLAVETTPPHAGLPTHVHHREDEAMYILEGEYEIVCGDKTFRATAGAFVFLPRNVPNRYQNIGGTPGKFLYITSPGGFEKFMAEMSAITTGAQPDAQKVAQTLRKYEIEMS